MRGGPRSFPQGFTCPVVLWILPPLLRLRLRGFHPLRPVFPVPFRWLHKSIPQSEPRYAPHTGLGSSGSARRYSRNHFCFLFLRLLRCFSSPGSPPQPIQSYPVQLRIHGVLPCGFPHSEIRGSVGMCPSPRLFAACHVFLRLPVPRHPPCALSCLTSLPARRIALRRAAPCSFNEPTGSRRYL